MQIARIVTPFAVAVILFILSYLTLDEGYVWLLFGIIGFILVVFGIYLTATSRD